MSSATSALVIAIIGIIGTLSSALLTQHSANRSRRQEIEYADKKRREDREIESQQAAIEARRACYIALNTAARLYQTELTNYLHALSAKNSPETLLDQLEKTRREHRARHAEAQMIVPDRVLESASAVNRQLGSLYGILREIDQGNPEEESIARAEAMRVEAWDLLAEMRAVMRRDLGVAS